MGAKSFAKGMIVLYLNTSFFPKLFLLTLIKLLSLIDA
ncbi:hypothetical protein J5U21_01840 [Saccharolobus shibatae]|uniref:Uncharacterized protein n=1 Tax=Saccharolobus shibatae TaxID=2286 RepID=A0A8F5GWL2_9CREN|nr:hypothetical protein J5U21_01840 [Saccharolobus shibatae]